MTRSDGPEPGGRVIDRDHGCLVHVPHGGAMSAWPASPIDQRAVIDFLSDPASYDLHGEAVERIETHCSIVFLAADRAYKLKRAIRYASLDYTTRALRQAACEAELVLNRRTAPELYLQVCAIAPDAAGRLSFDGPGPPLDHVVVMRRFAQAELFDHLAETGKLTPDLMRRLGVGIARFHLAAETTPAHGGSAAMRRAIADNERELAKVATALDGAAVDTLASRARAAQHRLAPVLEHRRAEAKIRRCHGDLRLANICLYAGRPTLFDCIEFSDEVGCIDVLYDFAFLLMDLLLLNRSDLANAAFNAYLDIAPETEGLRTLPLFLALRAATRSYALAGSAARQRKPGQAARRLLAARRHIDAGIAFLAPQPPLLIALGGDGDGKTELAEMLAAVCPPAPGARLLHEAGTATSPWPGASPTLAAGCSVLIDGEFRSEGARNAVAELAVRTGRPWRGFWFGSVPPGLDTRLWQVLDPAQGLLCALANATPLVNPFTSDA